MELEVSFGNHKLPKDTLIFNMGTSEDCPSKRLELCKIADKCYAKKAETQYPAVTAYRQRQEKAWKSLSAKEIHDQFLKKIMARRTKTEYIRFNESGDFWSQKDVTKLNELARLMKGVAIVYGYTARSDLDFSNLCDNLIVNGSGFMLDNEFTVVENNIDVKELFKNFDAVCCGDCGLCDFCKGKRGVKIAVRRH